MLFEGGVRNSSAGIELRDFETLSDRVMGGLGKAAGIKWSHNIAERTGE